MKLLSFVFISALIASVSAFAATTVKKTRYECANEVKSQTFDSSGKLMHEADYSVKTSEGTQVKWEQDGVSYRFRDFTSYGFTLQSGQPATPKVAAQVKSMTKTVRTEKGGRIVYSGETRSVSKYVPEFSDPSRAGKIVDKTSTFEDTYSLVGDQEILVKSEENGMEVPVWVSTSESKSTGENAYSTVETFQVPHYEYDRESGQTELTLKYVRTCRYEILAD